ncbi:methylated-DNA--[protein]-cysteine S-methyltransferase [Candidatus Peregrinibacteria bacterium]|nr:methylated-DNA--[protein]-cysteine S-methyltransferase [Candidatus Peregrinibacteria bacterium]
MTEFKERVYNIVKKIPSGEVMTYGQIAKALGQPGAARAVGNALNKNCDPDVPCHRVIKSDGTIGGFAFGTENKIARLADEGFIKPLTAEWFNRPVLQVAKELIGMTLAREINGSVERFKITETEAYDGENDKACHAAKGRTKRTEILYGPPGTFYVYLCYGMHWLLNVVTGPVDYPSAVLIRGAGKFDGPAKLTKALQINGTLHAKQCQKESGLWIENIKLDSKLKIKRTPRIGVDYAGPVWSSKQYRFILVS